MGVCTCGYGNMSFLCMWDFVMCGFLVWVCICVGFVMCVCVCVGFLMCVCGCVYVWLW